MADLPLLIVLAHRPDDLPREAEPLRALPGSLGTRAHALEPLTSEAVARIVRDEVGDEAEDEFCEECRRATGGNPFETVELAIRLGEHDLRGTRHELRAMRDLAAAVKGRGLVERLRALGTTTVRFAYAAAVLGESVSQELAATIAVVGSEAAAEATERLRAARILAEDDGTGDGLAFVHPLIATTIYRSIAPALRVGLHNGAAEAVRAAGFGPAAAARHLLEVPCDGRVEAVACLREAAREYMRAGAPEAARRLLTRALQEPPPPEQRAELLHELASSTFLIKPTPRSRTSVRRWRSPASTRSCGRPSCTGSRRRWRTSTRWPRPRPSPPRRRGAPRTPGSGCGCRPTTSCGARTAPTSRTPPPARAGSPGWPRR